MNIRLITFLIPPAVLLAACVITPPPPPLAANDPSNPQAPESVSPRYRPATAATTRKYLATSAGAGAQDMSGMNMSGGSGMDHGGMKGMDSSMPGMSKMKGKPQDSMKGMDHGSMNDGERMDGSSMKGMDHNSMPGMSGMQMPMTGGPKNGAEKETANTEKQEPRPPTGEQLQSTHPTSYTCRMHPSVKSAKPGKCPICGMTLVSKETVMKQKAVDQTKGTDSKPNP